MTSGQMKPVAKSGAACPPRDQGFGKGVLKRKAHLEVPGARQALLAALRQALPREELFALVGQQELRADEGQVGVGAVAQARHRHADAQVATRALALADARIRWPEIRRGAEVVSDFSLSSSWGALEALYRLAKRGLPARLG